MRVYYLPTGKIIKVARSIDRLPEDSPRTAINAPHSVIEIDESTNSNVCQSLLRGINQVEVTRAGARIIPDRYSVKAGQLINTDTEQPVIIKPGAKSVLETEVDTLKAEVSLLKERMRL
jgi:hypothetical protein